MRKASGCSRGTTLGHGDDGARLGRPANEGRTSPSSWGARRRGRPSRRSQRGRGHPDPVGGHGDEVTVDDPDRLGASPATAGPWAGAVPARKGSPSCSEPAVEQVTPGRQDELARARLRDRGRLPLRRGRRGGPSGLPGRQRRAHLGADLGDRAGAEEDAHLVGEHRQHAVVAHRGRVEGRGRRDARAPPSRGRCRRFSACGATGRMTSACSVTAAGPDLEGDDEGASKRPRRRRGGRCR
jgi:hypothetical protein